MANSLQSSSRNWHYDIKLITQLAMRELSYLKKGREIYKVSFRIFCNLEPIAASQINTRNRKSVGKENVGSFGRTILRKKGVREEAYLPSNLLVT